MTALILSTVGAAFAGIGPPPPPPTPEIDAGLLALMGASISAAFVAVKNRMDRRG
ncbi:MAG: hypothetical protein KC777_20545 [Cyanobacteria bacterium HKST-UBA02]|nr:hypothetical protein [Cyanobacteria bacterium HKST-UBA02]